MRTEEEILKNFEKLGWTVNNIYATELSFLKKKIDESGEKTEYEIVIDKRLEMFKKAFSNDKFKLTKFYDIDQIKKRYIRDEILTRKEQKLLIKLFKCWWWL